MSHIDRKISCVNDQIGYLTVNSLRMRNFSLVGLALSATFAAVAFVINAVALKVLVLSTVTLSLAGLLTSYVQSYLKHKAESELELLDLKKQNYQLRETTVFDNEQRRVTQKILDSVLDFEGHEENEQFAQELDRFSDELEGHWQSDIYLVDGQKAVLC